jgi:AraC-like DNA-binding protein
VRVSKSSLSAHTTAMVLRRWPAALAQRPDWVVCLLGGEPVVDLVAAFGTPPDTGVTEATAPRHLILPATASVLLVVEMVDSPRRPPALVVGAHDSFTVLEGAGARSWLGLLLAPLGAYRLLGPPMAELSGQLVDLTEVLGADGRRLGERLREAPTWRHRFALLDSFLLRRLDGGPRPAPEVAWAWRRLVATGGRMPIGQLADEVGWSHRHLIARFRQQVGLRPKTAARLIRFDGVLRRLDQGRPLDWGLVAREAGYADQAHLIRDFHQFSGTTPTAFVAQTIRPGGDGERQVNFVQDTLADAS